MWSFLFIIIWFTTNDQRLIMANPMTDDLSVESTIHYARANIPKDLPEIKVNHEHLIKEWQDWVLANLISVNYLNSLMVLASRDDFAFVIPTFYQVKYVQDIQSFRQTIAQLAAEIIMTLTHAREDLNRVHTGMKDVPDYLKNMILLIKQASYQLLQVLLPDSYNDIEKKVNDSLVVLRKPKQNFEQVLNLVTEIDFLLNVTSVDQMIALQVYDVKTQWTLLTELIFELAKQAETARESFLLQFNWILKEIVKPGFSFNDSDRNMIIRLLTSKTIELDQTCDLLLVITKTYTDISFKYTDDLLGGNGYLLLLADEKIRKQHLKKFHSELLPMVIQIARLALSKHNEFLERDKNREINYQ